MFSICVISCSESSSETKEMSKEVQPQETPKEKIKLTSKQLLAKEKLTKRLSKLMDKGMSGDEIAQISSSIAHTVTSDPDVLIPMMSYYEFYDKRTGAHYKRDSWEELQFIGESVNEGTVFYNPTYPLYLLNNNTHFSWYMSIVSEDGEIRKDKVGGRIFIASTKLKCSSGLTLHFSLKNGTIVRHEIPFDQTCNLPDGIAASLNLDIVNQLGSASMESIGITDNKTSTSITIRVENKYMSRYFERLVSIWNTEKVISYSE